MRDAEHLTTEQLRAYAADRAETPVRGRFAAHLVKCPDCRARLPKPSPEQFIAALFTENTINETGKIMPIAQADSRRPQKRSNFGFGEAFFPAKNLAWGAAGAFVLLAGFLLAGWWLTATKNPGDGEIANIAIPQSPAVTSTENKNAAPEQTPLIVQTDNDRNIQQAANKNSMAKTSDAVADEVQRRRSGDERISDQRPNLIERKTGETETESQNATEREIAALLEKTPPSVASLQSGGAAVLRSGNQSQTSSGKSAFSLAFPVGETVLDAQPEFRWQAVKAAKSYRISIQNSSYDEVASATVSRPVFKVDKPLARGEIYLWRVTAKTDSGEIVAPQPPAPPARFRVADEKTEKQIAESPKQLGGKLARAAFLAREGMLDPAARLLRDILRANPRDKSARRLLKRVQEWQRTAR